MHTVVINTLALISDVLSNPYVGLRRLVLPPLKPSARKRQIMYLAVTLLESVGRASVIYDFGINLRLVEMVS